jgi:hypothetical protein
MKKKSNFKNKNTMKTIDFYVKNCHSVIMLYPETEQAKDWINDNVSLDDWQSKDQIAIEPRMFLDIYDALIAESMILEAI